MALTLRLLPPSPVTTQVTVDLRAGFPDAGETADEVRFFVTPETTGKRVEIGRCKRLANPAFSGAMTRLKTADFAGKNQIECELYTADGALLDHAESSLEVWPSGNRSRSVIDGAWCGIYHWSEEEGRFWNQDLKNFTTEDWRNLVHAMASLDMRVIVLQELFRNQEYQGKHTIPETGYHGKAFYPSKLFPMRMDFLACQDPVEAILSAADECDMQVLSGIGMYAWFDFTPGSLDWHKQVAREVFQRYGHHKSFYGWYISEEVMGNLHYGERGEDTAGEIVDFFHGFRQLRDELNYAMPIMLAPNCFYVPAALEHWNRLAKELDIICPFAFHRMEKTDISCEEAIALFQRIADENGAHLWLDMEVFDFAEGNALVPRGIQNIERELKSFLTFEKILCYQFPGLLNPPQARLTPGGAPTVKLFQDYLGYWKQEKERCCGKEKQS